LAHTPDIFRMVADVHPGDVPNRNAC